MDRSGWFVTFEGPEGAGKSTQQRRLAGALRARGQTVVETREPGGTPIGERIRTLLLEMDDVEICAETEALLHNAARAQHVRSVIQPALGRGEIVLCDRFADSTLAYQGGGRGLSLVALRAVQALAVDGVLPDVRILLDLPVEIGLARRRRDAATVNRIDAETSAFHRRVRQAFLDLAKEEPEAWVVVDASVDADRVAADIWERLAATRLPRLVETG